MPSTAGIDTTADVRRGGLLFVTATLRPGGAERVLVNLANGCAAQVPTTLVSLSLPGGALRDHVRDDVELIELARPRVRSAAAALVRLIRSRRPAVVVTSQAHVTILLALLRPLLPSGVTTVAREADLRSGRSLAHRGVRLAHRTLYRAHALVLASSRHMADDLARRRRGPIAVLPNPVDEVGLRTSATSSPGAHDDAGTGRRFVHVGRLVPEKRIVDLVEAFAAGATTADRLVLVGDGPERTRIAERVAHLGLADRVALVGFDATPERPVARADLLILASASEGMPNVVLESLAVGTPVLATTDLVVLQDLATEAPHGAVRLVPRGSLASALAATAPTREDGAVPRPSLLPPEHRQEAVVDRFLALVGVRGDAPA